jgi:hypothetical protein
VVCKNKKIAEHIIVQNVLHYNAMVCPELVFNTKGQQPTHYIIDGQKEIIKIERTKL